MTLRRTYLQSYWLAFWSLLRVCGNIPGILYRRIGNIRDVCVLLVTHSQAVTRLFIRQFFTHMSLQWQKPETCVCLCVIRSLCISGARCEKPVPDRDACSLLHLQGGRKACCTALDARGPRELHKHRGVLGVLVAASSWARTLNEFQRVHGNSTG